MKKVISIIFAAALLLSTAACGDNGSADISNASAAEIASAVMEKTVFVDEMLELQTKIASDFYDIPDGVDDFVVYMSSSGATAEELSVFKCADSSQAKLVKSACEKRVEALKEKFEDYIPAELDKINSAVIKERGNFVMFICADSTAEAVKAFTEFKK